MKAQMKTAVAVFGGISAVALAVGFGGVGAGPTGAAATPATHSAPSAAPMVAPGGGAHVAILAACVSGLDC